MGMTLLVVTSALIATGRFTIPGHDLTGWPGFYEAVAHIWIGVLLTIGCQRGRRRAAAWWILAALTVLEVVMFKMRTP